MTPTPHDYQTLSLSLVLMGVLMVLGVWVGRATWRRIREWRPWSD